MDYDHSHTCLRLQQIDMLSSLSPWKKFLVENDPLKQQADLERENFMKRPSRRYRYSSVNIFEIGERKIEDRSLAAGLKLFGYSFLSGFFFIGFLTTPVGCLAHSLRSANMASGNVIGDMIYAGLKTGIRAGTAYGAMLGVFRTSNLILSGKWYDFFKPFIFVSSNSLKCNYSAVLFRNILLMKLSLS